ncbi:MAG: hypothetical protein M0R30_04420 [Methanoregula sp.]|jgi:hypothetical protein|uniref:hypothetical protein n=1 Tax=Methanoregula sp. TaxID=2052170 RepID=UPI0025DF9C0B|nr:hypothetical protein [Methanoregula sp.]MCK9630864.1 hypothetical protein [Methanoregula sp.]
MTYLNWGCDPLAAECESCLDALCNVCLDGSRKRPGVLEHCDGPGGDYPESPELDCDNCDLEKKPDCVHCEIIFQVCQGCGENQTCEFRISG